MRFVAILLIFLSWLACGAQQVSLPAWYETTTSLNVRASDNTSSRIITVLPSHTRIRVDYITDKNWAAIQHLQQRGFVSTKYIKYVEVIPQMPTQRKEVSSSYSSKKGIISWLFDIGILIVVIIIIRKIAIYVLGIGSICMYWHHGSRECLSIYSTGYNVSLQNHGAFFIRATTGGTTTMPNLGKGTNG